MESGPSVHSSCALYFRQIWVVRHKLCLFHIYFEFLFKVDMSGCHQEWFYFEFFVRLYQYVVSKYN
jgi:hypothetical protein